MRFKFSVSNASLVGDPIDVTSCVVGTKICAITAGIEKNQYISHDKFLSVNNILREYYEMKKELKNLQTFVKYNM